MMRWIKSGVISVMGIGMLLTGLSLLIPAQTRVSRAITIDQPAAQVKARLQSLTDWPQWNLLLRSDRLTGIQAGDRFFHSDQMNVRLVNQEGGKWVTEWEWAGQPPVHSSINLTAAGQDATVVQWVFEFRVKWYPWEKFGSIIFDKQLGYPMEQSLDELKRICNQ